MIGWPFFWCHFNMVNLFQSN